MVPDADFEWNGERDMRIPRQGDIVAIWRLERTLGLCVPGFDSCCASRLNRRSELGSLQAGALLDFLPFVASGLKTNKGIPLTKNVDNCKYIVNAGGGSSL